MLCGKDTGNYRPPEKEVFYWNMDKETKRQIEYRNPVALSDAVYRRIVRDIVPLKTGVDPVMQLASRLSTRLTRKESIRVAGFICPFYEYDDEDKVTGIGRGGLKEHDLFNKKFSRLTGLAEKLKDALGQDLPVQLDVVMGDTGIADRTKMGDNFEKVMRENVCAYRDSFAESGIQLQAKFMQFSQIIGGYGSLLKSGSDLMEDGRLLTEDNVSFYMNPGVSEKLQNTYREYRSKGISHNIAAGFALNYGIAGLVMRQRGVDIFIGTDFPNTAGHFRNYLYHTFMNSGDLLVFVPK